MEWLLDESQWYFYALTFACLLVGIALGYLGQMKRLNALAKAEDQPTPSWKAYYYDYPYATLYSVLSSVLGYGMLFGLGELSIITAIGMGFVGETVSDTASERAKKAIGAVE